MIKFFSSLKDKFVGGPDGCEPSAAESADICEISGSNEEASLMVVPSEQAEESSAVAVAIEISEMEQMESEVAAPEVQEIFAEISCPEIREEQAADGPGAKDPMPAVAATVQEESKETAGAPAADQTAALIVVSPPDDAIGSDGTADHQLSSPATACAAPTAAVPASNAGDLCTNTSSESSDTSSWEPKTKDVKMALSEKGDNNPDAVVRKETIEGGTIKLTKPEVIHPLQNSWGIWCFMQNRCQDWHENVRHISNFSSVEDFWSLFNHIQSVDNLPIGCDYYIFKANIQPMWEDRANVNGGRWLLKIPQAHPNFVHLWNETLLLLVGEAFEAESESICGAVAQVRRGFNKISIWTRDAADRAACMRIGYRWKKCIKLAAPIHYEAHLEVNRKGGRRSKSVYSIN